MGRVMVVAMPLGGYIKATEGLPVRYYPLEKGIRVSLSTGRLMSIRIIFNPGLVVVTTVVKKLN